MRRALAISTIAHSLLFGMIFVTGYESQPISIDVIEVSLIEAPKQGARAEAIEQVEQKPPKPEEESQIKYKTEEKKPKEPPKKTQKPAQPKSEATKSTKPSTSKSPGATGIKVDSEGFNFGYYLEIVRERISDNWSPPPVGSEVVVSTVYFKIRRTGEITDIKLEKSSGFELYDMAAMKAVSDATPLPPLPAGFKGQWLGVHFEFEYKSGG